MSPLKKEHNNNNDTTGGIMNTPQPTTSKCIYKNHATTLDPTFTAAGTLLISLETEPVPRKEIDTALLDERKQQMDFLNKMDDLSIGTDDNNNNNTLIERRRGTSLYLEPSFCSAIETAVSATKTTDLKLLDKVISTNEPIFTPKQSRHSILAQIERQNALLEKDPKSICIQSNELRGHYTTVQQLVTDYQPLYSPPLSSHNNDDDTYDDINNNDKIGGVTIKDRHQQIMDWAFWQALIQDPLHVANKIPHLLSIKLRAGIPPHARGLIWQAVCQSDCLHLETVYGQLCKEHSPHERVIKRDLTRTFPNVDMFKQENGPGQLALCRILVAYSLYDAHVGYCQGLAFLVGPLLMNMPEPQAFCVFVRMMETYEMRSMFTLDMEGLQLRLYQFSRLLEEHLPNLAAHLDKHSIHAAMYASQWFLTLFAYAFPLDLVTRIYDILFVEGATETMMRVSIAMLQRSEPTILAEDEFEDLLDCVTTRKLCAPYMDDWSEAIQDAMSLSNTITRQKLDGLERQYAQQGQQEKNKTEQVLVNRLGGFWRRKSTKKSKVSTLERSVSDSGSRGGGGGGGGHSVDKINKWPNRVIKQTRNSVHSVDGVYSSAVLPPTPSTIVTTDHDVITEELLQALDQLRREHSRTIDELFETRMDKKDVESERDALKMTIMELERRYQTSPEFGHSSPASETISSKSTVINDQHECELAATFVSCDAILGKTRNYGKCTSGDDLFFDTPKIKSYYDPTLGSQKCETDLIETSYTMDHQNSTGDDYDVLSALSSEDGTALRTELVRVKVDHFESQQQCERLGQEVEDLQARLDMVNEGQLALVDKLVTMKSEMDDLLLNKKRHEEKWVDLVEENSQLTMQLQQQPTKKDLMNRIDELETSLAATKIRLAELESSTDHHHRQLLRIDRSNPTAKHDDDLVREPGHLGRSGSLYGRMWHVISPRSQSLRSS